MVQTYGLMTNDQSLWMILYHEMDIHSSKIVIGSRLAIFEGTRKGYKASCYPSDFTKTIIGVKSGQSTILHAFQTALL